MKHYKHYSVEDFVDDLRFRAWVRRPSTAEDQFWQELIGDYPSQRDTIMEARAIVLSIHPVPGNIISNREVNDEVASILARITVGEDEKEAEEDGSASGKLWRWVTIAASVVIVAVGSWFAGTYVSKQTKTNVALREVVVAPGNYMIERVNKGVEPLLIGLPDNSSVLLSQNSILRYPRQFSAHSREIFLEGTAFFEVTKDPGKPFYVDAGRITAKVLGTSFEISTNPSGKQVSVVVKSGTVSIYSNSELGRDTTDSQPKVILTKHEQFIFRDEVAEIRHTRLDSLSIEKLKLPETGLRFEATPAVEVFESLARVYRVAINVDDARISECSVTASFTDEPFPLKLDLICRSIGVKYEIVNDQVTITGNGCKN